MHIKMRSSGTRLVGAPPPRTKRRWWMVRGVGVLVLGAWTGRAEAQQLSEYEGPWHAAMVLGPRLDEESPDRLDILEAARSEVALGRPRRAMDILSRHALPDSMVEGEPLAVFAAAQYGVGEYAVAGGLFSRAAGHATGLRRAVFQTRAAEAYERAGMLQEAAAHYHRAGVESADARGWLALREARLTTQPALALELLRLAPEGGSAMRAEVQASVMAAAGDTAGAVEVLAGAGQYAEAGRLALLSSQGAEAREWLYQAIAGDDRSQALSGVESALDQLPPRTAEEHAAVGRAIYRFGKAAEAVPHFAAAVASGDSSVTTYLLWAQATEASGDRWGALRIYGMATDLPGDSAVEASYRYARTQLRLRQRSAAYRGFSAFLESHPQHSRAPAVLFLMGGLRGDQGLIRQADSLYALVNARWPESGFASRARMRLAARALARRDTIGAMDMYRSEAQQGSASARVAQFHVARLAFASGDSATAYAEWADLARRDSIGYYGTAAREAAGLPPPTFAAAPLHEPSPKVTKQLAVLDLLTGARLEREAEALIEHLSDPAAWRVEELMDVAEGLIARGRARRAVRLGWRIASLYRLNDPRVLRIIFPWPNRELVEREAKKFDLDPYLLVALIRQESAFDANATSRAGARGMMQLMPATASWLAGRLRLDWENRFLAIADANVHLGAAHLSAILGQYDGEVVPALAAYNAGGSRARRWLRFPEAGDWFRFIERIPFAETRGYVQTLLRNRLVYSALYGGPAAQ